MPTHAELIDLVGRMHGVLINLQQFDVLEVRGVVKGLLSPAPRDICFTGLYYSEDAALHREPERGTDAPARVVGPLSRHERHVTASPSRRAHRLSVEDACRLHRFLGGSRVPFGRSCRRVAEDLPDDR